MEVTSKMRGGDASKHLRAGVGEIYLGDNKFVELDSTEEKDVAAINDIG